MRHLSLEEGSEPCSHLGKSLPGKENSKWGHWVGNCLSDRGTRRWPEWQSTVNKEKSGRRWVRGVATRGPGGHCSQVVLEKVRCGEENRIVPINLAIDKKAPEGNINKKTCCKWFPCCPQCLHRDVGNYFTWAIIFHIIQERNDLPEITSSSIVKTKLRFFYFKIQILLFTYLSAYKKKGREICPWASIFFPKMW